MIFMNILNDSVLAERAVDRIPKGAQFSAPPPSRADIGAHPDSCTMGTGLFPSGKAAGEWR